MHNDTRSTKRQKSIILKFVPNYYGVKQLEKIIYPGASSRDKYISNQTRQLHGNIKMAVRTKHDAV
jgi:hypothetical protein